MPSSGVAACNHTIQRLIRRVAQRVFAAGQLDPSADQLSVSLPATQASLPEYYQLERFADREEYHARLHVFIRAGAVAADWDRSAGDRGQLARVTIVSPIAAAELFEVELPWTTASKAISELSAVATDGLPAINHILEAWRHGKAPGGIGAEKSRQLVDCMRVIEAAQNLGAAEKDLLMRRVSAQLFGDSKRIESLSRQLAFLLDGPEETGEDVFARLGLVKHPQPMLLSGPQSCRVQAGGKSIPLVRPYLGLRPDTIDGLQVGSEPVRCLLTIENLASFNEAAQDASNPNDLLLIYVAGNPTPSLLAAYGRLLKSVQPETVVHWGDIDIGGFRIAARLADHAADAGHKLELWRMNPAEAAFNQHEKANERKIQQIATICEKYGWSGELEGLKKHPVFQEQEFIKWEPLFSKIGTQRTSSIL